MFVRAVLIATSVLIPQICGQFLVPLVLDSIAQLAIEESLGESSNEDVGLFSGQRPNYTASVLFRLYTRKLNSVGVDIQADPTSLLTSPMDPNAPTKIFVFGFENRLNSEPALELKDEPPGGEQPKQEPASHNQPGSSIMKELTILIEEFLTRTRLIEEAVLSRAYLTRSECNFIVVDWSELSRSINYLRVRSHVAGVANVTARFLDALADSGMCQPKDQHIIGHSLGAHIAGIASRAAKTKPGRCTGLDPAGPLFELASSGGRIDRSSAILVDIIHTAAGSWGIPTPVGHIDFYANGGTWPQPDCLGEVTDLFGFCSHLLSFHYFSNTILHPTIYIGSRCQRSSIIRGLCPEDAVSAVMGEEVVFEVNHFGDIPNYTGWIQSPFTDVEVAYTNACSLVIGRICRADLPGGFAGRIEMTSIFSVSLRSITNKTPGLYYVEARINLTGRSNG